MSTNHFIYLIRLSIDSTNQLFNHSVVLQKKLKLKKYLPLHNGLLYKKEKKNTDANIHLSYIFFC